jgi:sulfur relay (sulfurtransferase) complex TusBCD TusD component (DsrE family)
MLTLNKFINQQESIVKELLQAIMENESRVQYCCYCVERRGEKMSCCSENHWIEFRDLDDETQLDIVREILENE